MKAFTCSVARLLAVCYAVIASMAIVQAETVPIFITIGQSNADGSAFFDATQDSILNAWYTSDENTGKLKIWYRSTQIDDRHDNVLGERTRWVVDGAVEDAEPGWMNLWYRNENTHGRTAMNMIHSYGTYSTGDDGACAQGRRGMEGAFGMQFAKAFPDKELYILKLGASGSFISSWANPVDNVNWDYFFNNIYKPAIDDLLAQGKTPVLAGIWWMQGCADSGRDQAYYETWLRILVEKCRTHLGFPDAKFYIGHIMAPGENEGCPDGSTAYSPAIRAAQDAVAEAMDGVEILDTRNCSMQYEAPFHGYIHFDHAGVNTIGRLLAEKVIADSEEGWATYRGYIEPPFELRDTCTDNQSSCPDSLIIQPMSACSDGMLTIIADGNGSVEVWAENDDADLRGGGTRYLTGDMVPENTGLTIYLKPRPGEVLLSVIVDHDGDVYSLEDSDEGVTLVSYDPDVYEGHIPCVTGDVTLSVLFSENVLGIDQLLEDSTDDVTYYDLHGHQMKHPAGGGIYIRRQGKRISKITL